MDLYTVRNNIMNGVSLHDLKLRVCYYARVSTEKDLQLHSLDAQISYFEEYIKSIDNWDYAGSYIDEGISGTSVNKRDNFLRMIEDSKCDKFDLILTKEISRFSRNTIDSIKYTQELLLNGVAVYFLNDNINTLLPDSELRLTIMSSIAQDEVRKLSERVSFGMKKSIKNGVVLGSSNIYGYKKSNGKLIIDEYQAEMIKIIFDRYANTSDGLSKISRYLYSLGYTSKSGKIIDTTIIKRIIKNPKYMGFYCGNKSKVIDYRTKKKKYLDEAEWIIYKDYDSVPAIISEDIWNRANKKLNDRNKLISKNSYNNRYTYSGKLFCKYHNLTYHRAGSGKRINNPVWECQVYRKLSLRGCDNIKVKEKDLDNYFYKLFNDLLIKRNIINSLIDEFKCFYKKNKSSYKLDNIVLSINNCLDNKDCFMDIFNLLIKKIIVDKENIEIIFYNDEVLRKK